jgi:hypothetical protein
MSADRIIAQSKAKPKGKVTPTKPDQGPGSITPAAETKIVQSVKNAQAAVRRLMSHPEANSTEVRALLAAGKVDGRKYDHDVINAAFDLAQNGGLSPQNVRALRGMGVHAKRYFPVAKVLAKSRPFG